MLEIEPPATQIKPNCNANIVDLRQLFCSFSQKSIRLWCSAGDVGKPLKNLENQFACVLLAPDNKTPVGKSDEDDSPDETEQKGVEVGRHAHVPRYPKQLTPAEVQKVSDALFQF